MTDVGTGFLEAISAFFTTKLGKASETTWKDAGSLVDSLHDGIPDNTKPAFNALKADIKNDAALVKDITKAIKKQTDLIAKMAKECKDDIDAGDFTKGDWNKYPVLPWFALGCMGSVMAAGWFGGWKTPRRRILMSLGIGLASIALARAVRMLRGLSLIHI